MGQNSPASTASVSPVKGRGSSLICEIPVRAWMWISRGVHPHILCTPPPPPARPPRPPTSPRCTGSCRPPRKGTPSRSLSPAPSRVPGGLLRQDSHTLWKGHIALGGPPCPQSRHTFSPGPFSDPGVFQDCQHRPPSLSTHRARYQRQPSARTLPSLAKMPTILEMKLNIFDKSCNFMPQHHEIFV